MHKAHRSDGVQRGRLLTPRRSAAVSLREAGSWTGPDRLSRRHPSDRFGDGKHSFRPMVEKKQSFWPRLFFSGPFNARALFNHIAEPVPVKLPLTERAAQFYLPFGNGNDLPISLSGTALNINLLSHPERIRLEYCHIVGCHNSSILHLEMDRIRVHARACNGEKVVYGGTPSAY